MVSIGFVQDDWLDRVCPFIQERIDKYAQSEIRFNLMAVIRNRSEFFSERLQALEARRAEVAAAAGPDAMDADGGHEGELGHLDDEASV